MRLSPAHTQMRGASVRFSSEAVSSVLPSNARACRSKHQRGRCLLGFARRDGSAAPRQQIPPGSIYCPIVIRHSVSPPFWSWSSLIASAIRRPAFQRRFCAGPEARHTSFLSIPDPWRAFEMLPATPPSALGPGRSSCRTISQVRMPREPPPWIRRRNCRLRILASSRLISTAGRSPFGGRPGLRRTVSALLSVAGGRPFAPASSSRCSMSAGSSQPTSMPRTFTVNLIPRRILAMRRPVSRAVPEFLHRILVRYHGALMDNQKRRKPLGFVDGVLQPPPTPPRQGGEPCCGLLHADHVPQRQGRRRRVTSLSTDRHG